MQGSIVQGGEGMDWRIGPNVGGGPLRVGMARQEVRRTIGIQPTGSATVPRSSSPTDAFLEQGLHIYYDDSDHCAAIERAVPATPTLAGRLLLGEPFCVVRDWLSTLDPGFETDDAG